MAKSRRFKPGDSVPDFSHLADHVEDLDDPDWASDVAVPASESPPAAPEPSPDPEPPDAAASPEQKKMPPPQTTEQDPAGQSHVFFETDEPLDKEAVAGATTALIDRDAGDALPPIVDDEATGNRLPADADNPLAELPAAESSGLSDVQFPSFEEPADTNDDDGDEATGSEATESEESTGQSAARFAALDDVADTEEDAPMFPGPGDVEEAEGPVFGAVEDNDDAVPDFTGIVTESGEPVAPPERAVPELSEPAAPVPVARDSEKRPQQKSRSKETDERRRRKKSSGKSRGDRSGSPPRSDKAKRSASGRVAAKPEVDPAENRRRLLLILLASYASAVTLACLWLWLSRNTARPHDLESLPDVAPLDANEFRYAPQNASMPRGHTLPVGQQQRLGYLQVEPLRITRGPVQFVHYADAKQTRPATVPVLKLWLKFTNVSSDQLIAPLDATLMLTRHYNVETDTVQANQLVLSAADKPGQKPACVLDHPVTSDWDMVGQQLGHRLKPGESLETYIPLEPGTDAHLTGELLWRVHFRKGYHDPSGHGVTTMIEVPFSQADVRSEPS